MRVSDIIRLAQDYIGLAIVLVGILGVCFILGYFVIYKKVLKGKKQLSKGRVALMAIFLCYLIVVLGATLGRGAHYDRQEIDFRPFRAYWEAWNNFSLVEWRNIILNICMFIPLGFLLPLMGNIFQNGWMTYLTGFLFSLFIEGVQLIAKRGIVEVDDLINNTVGCMIGYGMVMMVIELFKWFKCKNQNISFVKMGMIQLPLVITLLAFGLIFYSYDQKEFGNLRSAPVFQVNMSNIELISDLSFSDAVTQAAVYAANVGTKADTREVADQWFSYVGATIDDSQTDVYDETIIYYSTDRDYLIWVDFLGLAISFRDWTHWDSPKQAGYTLEEVTEILGTYGITLPKDVIFVDHRDGTYTLEAKMGEVNGYYLDGFIDCTITTDGSIESIRNHMIQYEEYKIVDILSEAQAFMQLKKGNVKEGYLKYLDLMEPIEVKAVSLQYEMDSKGYCQPMYHFEVLNHNQSASILIPAIP